MEFDTHWAELAAVVAAGAAGVWLWWRHRAATGVATIIDDGDSFEVERRWPAGKVRIRLAWIDAPEHGQPFADQSRAALRQVLKAQRLKLRYIDTDHYGRRVTHVTAGGLDVGLFLLKGGHAWYYRDYASSQGWWRRRQYDAAERRARREGLGLWSQRKPEAPWTYRHRPWWKRWLSS